MAIMTGRYSNKELRNDGYYPVGISVGKPRFSTGYEIREQCYALAPRYDMLKLGYEEYKAEYFKKLDKIGVDKIIGREESALYAACAMRGDKSPPAHQIPGTGERASRPLSLREFLPRK